MGNDLIRKIPRFSEGERAILGGLLIDNSYLSDVVSVLKLDDFFHETNRTIYQAIVELSNANEPVDWLTLTSQLKESGLLDMVGGPATLTDLANDVPSAANIMHYVTRVKEKAQMRALIYDSNEIAGLCYEDKLDEAIQKQEQSVYKRVSKSKHSLQRFDSINAECYQQFKTNINSPNPPGIITGFLDIDRIVHGFRDEEVAMIAARPSMGKSTLARSFVTNMWPQGLIAIYTLEMSKREWWQGLITAESGVPATSFRRNKMNPDQIRMVSEAKERLNIESLFIDDNPIQTPSDILSKTSTLCAKKNVSPAAVIIDHVGLMHADKPTGNQYKDTSEIAKDLKRLAKRLGCPIFALCQLNRNIESRPITDRMPRMSDLRDTGEWEQSADFVIVLLRPYVYTKDMADIHLGYGEIIKGRGTGIGQFKLYWDNKLVLYRNHSERAFAV